jgi:ABC-type polysaccharide/polyol phosphate export permease
MFKTTIIGAILSLAAGGAVGWFLAAPYITANAPAEWSWLLVPVGSFLVGLVVFWVGWFLTVLATQAVMFRGDFA